MELALHLWGTSPLKQLRAYSRYYQQRVKRQLRSAKLPLDSTITPKPAFFNLVLQSYHKLSISAENSHS